MAEKENKLRAQIAAETEAKLGRQIKELEKELTRHGINTRGRSGMCCRSRPSLAAAARRRRRWRRAALRAPKPSRRRHDDGAGGERAEGSVHRVVLRQRVRDRRPRRRCGAHVGAGAARSRQGFAPAPAAPRHTSGAGRLAARAVAARPPRARRQLSAPRERPAARAAPAARRVESFPVQGGYRQKRKGGGSPEARAAAPAAAAPRGGGGNDRSVEDYYRRYGDAIVDAAARDEASPPPWGDEAFSSSADGAEEALSAYVGADEEEYSIYERGEEEYDDDEAEAREGGDGGGGALRFPDPPAGIGGGDDAWGSPDRPHPVIVPLSSPDIGGAAFGGERSGGYPSSGSGGGDWRPRSLLDPNRGWNDGGGGEEAWAPREVAPYESGWAMQLEAERSSANCRRAPTADPARDPLQQRARVAAVGVAAGGVAARRAAAGAAAAVDGGQPAAERLVRGEVGSMLRAGSPR